MFNQGVLNLIDVQLLQNTAQGGAAGVECFGPEGNAGGGGMGGNGGDTCNGDFQNGSNYVSGGGGFRDDGLIGFGAAIGGGFTGTEGAFHDHGGISVFGGNGGNGNNHVTGGGGGGFMPGR